MSRADGKSPCELIFQLPTPIELPYWTTFWTNTMEETPIFQTNYITIHDYLFAIVRVFFNGSIHFCQRTKHLLIRKRLAHSCNNKNRNKIKQSNKLFNLTWHRTSRLFLPLQRSMLRMMLALSRSMFLPPINQLDKNISTFPQTVRLDQRCYT